MAQKDAYISKMEARLKQLGEKVDSLAARAEKATAQGRAELRKQTEAAEAKYKEVSRRLAALRAASEESFATLKAGIDKAWHDLVSAFEKK